VRDDELAQVIEVFQRPEEPRATLEARVQAIEDRQAIRDVLYGYGYLCDARRWDELLEHYTDDIERVLGGTLTERVKGKAELRKLYVAPALPHDGEGHAPPAAQINTYELRHLITGDVVRLGADGRTGWIAAAYSLVASTDQPDGFRRGQHEGGYIFEMRKEDDGRWRVSKMIVFSENARNPLFQGSDS
jgi:ketosteroid isomerase-like protein